MKGLEIKEKLVNSGYKLSDIAQNMGVTPQSLHKFLMTEDIKTGVLERIAKAINKDIMFFFGENENKNEDIKLTNEIINRDMLLRSLYDSIVDVAILNKDYLNITKSLDTENAAKIVNNFRAPMLEYIEDEEGELVPEVVRWQEFDLDKKKLYNAELGESVRLLQDIFFEQFRLLYRKMRGFK